MASEGQAVRFRDCTCPGSPHNGEDGADDGDIVVLREHLGFAAGAEAYRKMTETIEIVDGKLEYAQEKMSELVGPVYLREGPISWNLVDERGPIPLTKQALETLTFVEALPIVDRADDLYSMEVASPLVKRTAALSGTTPTGSRTPRKTRSSSPRPSPRGSSSRNGTAGRPSPVNR